MMWLDQQHKRRQHSTERLSENARYTNHSARVAGAPRRCKGEKASDIASTPNISLLPVSPSSFLPQPPCSMVICCMMTFYAIYTQDAWDFPGAS
jgi:hypothetical protein